MPAPAVHFDLVDIDASTTVDKARRLVQEWLEANLPTEWRLAALSGGIEALRRVRPRQAYEDWYPVFAASGLVAPFWPREYGGLGVSNTVFRVIEEELAPFNMGRLNILGINLAGTTLLQWGTDEQKRRFLPPIIHAVETWCQLFSEPGAGSDLPSLATRATLDGDQWIVNGQKVWSTWAHESTHGLLLARTDPESPKREGLSYLLIEMDQPGVEVRPLRQINGDAEFNEVFLDNARVPADWILGRPGDGMSVARTTLGGERQMISGPGSGGVDQLGGRSLDRLIKRAQELGADGRSGWADPVLRQRIMRLWSERDVLTWTNQRARAARKANRPPGPESSIGKLMQAHHNLRLQELWIDLIGLDAVARRPDDDDNRRMVYGFLRSRANTIEGGTSEIQRTTLGERVLGLPREPDPYHGMPWSQVPRS